MKELSEKQKAALARGRAAIALKRASASASPPTSPASPAPVSVPPPASELPKIKHTSSRKWWQVFVGAGLLGLSVLFLVLYMQSPANMFIAGLFILFAASGGLMTFIGLRKREESIKFVRSKQVKINANCLNIYYGKAGGKWFCEKMAFEEMVSPAEYDKLSDAEKAGKTRGEIVSEYPQKCLNDGKWYYIHEFDPDRKYIKFILPDTQYYDPHEMVNPATMPAVKKVLRPKPTLGEKLRPVLLVVAIGILGVIMIATGTPPPPGG